ncbi:F420-0:Gamma-glutamyl ligase [Desertifilum sp. FACHB-1129]|uniref:F420-0:Gamma-glutamyl ligase n=1 Tax=Desertifilum tharense IPPAS B-1220 TaxID=1781255 RepID=A0A1E5QLI8_9CYAN|nr:MULTISPECIES: F420-0:Gamma-glutamyl ligase [Desertifilum]MBD2310957.1 F420-0:Gamma-glutamyl ligase [Desertifilum sp. FACHB-1129]MBD2321362.1 F420-0:Gamma-glutamyl ligase [Desertifilum sp. FACHB-866]MBD2331331.1 F420-0:Gamma-glutamyl ligase [Desertifilum sp. FACHB-868]OEJ75535.1 F420-0:Gamma-glutamyl ligase [Desertifilum tharense IPPAS B-1220]
MGWPILLGVFLGAIALLVVLFEWQFRQRPGNQLELTPGEWTWDIQQTNRYRLIGELELINRTRRLEIMVPELAAEVKLLSSGPLDEVRSHIHVTPLHPDASARADGYWFGYIVKVGKTTRLKVAIEITGPDLSQLQTAWIQVHYLTYGPEGRIPKTGHIIYPLQYPDPQILPKGRQTSVGDVFPIRTHLLTNLDDPVEMVKRYVLPHAKPGDIVTIGETPIAIMQGRMRHPSTLKPGWVAKRICYYFLPTSSLATACGMQSLVEVEGAGRVLFAFIVGAIAKAILRKPGVFYQLAGEQARLIDDVTGSLPPYDQFIVYGPENPQAVVDRIQKETGLSAAIVDVNDLKAVKILAATRDLSSNILEQALISNPAGNADEQTPVVLIRTPKN